MLIPCEVGWQKFQGFCYQFQGYRLRLFWRQAEIYCQTYKNSSLPSIHSRRENRFLARKISMF